MNIWRGYGNGRLSVMRTKGEADGSDGNQAKQGKPRQAGNRTAAKSVESGKVGLGTGVGRNRKDQGIV